MRKLASLTATALLTGSVLLTGVSVLACATYRDHLQRGQKLYQENEFERALSIWRVIEPDMDSLSWEEQARYSYLRGMTGYRLGFKSDARHWLAIAKAIDAEHPGGLDGDWPQRTEAALDELNRGVFGLEANSTDSKAIGHPVNLDEDLGRSTNEPASPQVKDPSGPVACRTEAECAAEEVCVSGRCAAD